MMTPEYRLSVELPGHFGVVRHIAALPNNVFASSSRDCTVRVWKLVNNTEWGLLNLLNCHKQLADKAGVAASHYIPEGTPGFPQGALVTAGYDFAVYVSHPESSEIYYHLVAHNDAVVSITHTPEGDIVSGSSDKNIIVWRNGQIFKQLRGHSSIVWALTTLPNGDIVSGSSDKTIRIWRNFQCVKTIQTNGYIRGLCVVPDVGFLSCGSGEALQLWSYDGEHLFDLVGHKDTVYSASVLPSGEIVSCSEDCTVIVWNGTELKQQLALPSSVWSVACMDNGDIVAGCQDKMIRVFTKDPTRQVSDEVLAEYTEDCLIAAAALAEAAKPEKHVVNGQEYDHIINVDLEEGRPTIPLGYNDDEEPVVAAERFVQQNNISPFYLDEITRFIANAMGPKKLASGTPYVDPFRDNIPDQYNPSSQPRQTQQQPKQTSSQLFPDVAPVLVEHGQIAPILSKLKQINSQFTPEESMYVLSESELQRIESMCDQIRYRMADPNHKPADFNIYLGVRTLLEVLVKWPEKSRFPLLDIIRLGMLLPDFAEMAKDNLLDSCKVNLESSASPLSHLMTLRVFCNAFHSKVFEPSLEALAEYVLEQVATLMDSSNAHVPPLAVSLVRNYASLLSKGKSEARVQILSLVAEAVLGTPRADPIVLLGLYSIGTLLERDADLRDLANQMGISSAVEPFANHANSDISKCAKSILSILKSK